MIPRPPVFISAVSKELRSARQLVVNTLQFLGYDSVYQDIFGTEQGDLRAMLRKRIDECKGVVQLVGQCYGVEPPVPDKQFGRVSYTQYEAFYARQQGKKVWYLVLDKDFPSDPHDAEPEELCRLQAAYRQQVQADTHLFHPLNSQDALKASVLQMRDELTGLRRGVRRWAVGVSSLLVLIAVLAVWLVIRGNPPPPPPTEEQANAAFIAKDYPAAFDAYVQLSDSDPTNVRYHRRIEECARWGHLGKAFFDRYLALVQHQPTNAMFHNYLGNAYLMMDPKDHDGKAQEQYEKAARLDPKLGIPLANLGIIAYRQGEAAKAESLFKQYLELCPQDAPAWVNLGLVYVAKVEKDASDREAALAAKATLEKALGMDPGLASAYKGLGRLFAATGHKPEALNAYQHCLALNYDQPEVRRQVELLVYETGDSSQPAQQPDDMETRSWNGTKLAVAAMQALEQKHYTEVERLSLELLRVQPENPLAYRLLGHAYQGQGRSIEAQQAFDKAPHLSEAEQN